VSGKGSVEICHSAGYEIRTMTTFDNRPPFVSKRHEGWKKWLAGPKTMTTTPFIIILFPQTCSIVPIVPSLGLGNREY